MDDSPGRNGEALEPVRRQYGPVSGDSPDGVQEVLMTLKLKDGLVPALLAVLLLGLSACQTPAPGPQAAALAGNPADIALGRQVAEARCASCHAIEAGLTSPLADAPSFATLYTRFPVEQLGDRIRGGLMVDHPRMPLLVSLAPDEERGLQAYLLSFRR